MSVSRSPRHSDDIRRREDVADAKRTTAIIATLCFFAAAAYVAGVVFYGWAR